MVTNFIWGKKTTKNHKKKREYVLYKKKKKKSHFLGQPFPEFPLLLLQICV